MKNKTLITAILLLSASSFLLIGSTKKEATIEEMYGTWVNSLYSGSKYRYITNKQAKIIINSDGIIAKYHSEIDLTGGIDPPLKKSTVPNETYSFSIEDSWIDREGNSWFKVSCFSNRNEIHYELWKLSNSGKTYELVVKDKDYPKEIDPNDSTYHVFYRYKIDPSEEICSTWINPDNEGRGKYYPAKFVYRSDGTWNKYIYVNEPSNSYGCGGGTYTLTDKWTDSEGNIWYKSTWWHTNGNSGYELVKISNSGETYEREWTGKGYPTEIDQNHKYYGIWYRQ
jgi:hypothetical protein